LRETSFTFLFAPHYHPAMKALVPVRKALGVRTVFNILGPLTNPAEPPFMVVGAFSPEVAALMAEALAGLPIQRAFVVHGEPGWDEATPCGPYLLFDVRPGNVSREERDPQEVGLAQCTPGDLAGGEAAENAAAIRAVLGGASGPHRDALTLGAGLALEVSGRAANLADGIEAPASEPGRASGAPHFQASCRAWPRHRRRASLRHAVKKPSKRSVTGRSPRLRLPLSTSRTGSTSSPR